MVDSLIPSRRVRLIGRAGSCARLGKGLLDAAHAGVDGLGALVFPSDCLVCGRALPRPLMGPLCAACLEMLPRIHPPFCDRCGLPYPPGVAPGLCGSCRSGPRSFRRARAGSPYVESVRLCVQALKYGGRRRIASILGKRAGRSHVIEGDLAGARAVVPIPLSRRRRRERGFNQAELIAKVVAREAGVPLDGKLLWKTKDRPPQAGLTRKDRLRNVQSVYRARLPLSLRGERLLLVDDVLTTGATAESAARALLEAGAGAVDVLTLARVPIS